MAETFLELCSQRLRSLVTRLCLAECGPPPEECCESLPVPLSPSSGYGDCGVPDNSVLTAFNPCNTEHATSANVCGDVQAYRTAKIQTYEYANRENVVEHYVDQQGSNQIRTTNWSRVAQLNGDNCSDLSQGGCWIEWQVPIVETYQYRFTDTINDITTTDGSVVEKCGRAWIECPFTGGGTISDGHYISEWLLRFYRNDPPAPSDFGLSEWNEGGGDGWRRNFLDERFDGTTLTSRLERRGTLRYASTRTRVEIWYDQSESEYTRTLTGYRNRTTTKSIHIIAEVGWDRECDGTDGPPTCVVLPTDCQPDNVGFIVGEPCGAGLGAPVVLPLVLIEGGCGTIEVQGECYTFRRDGVRIFDPRAIGAIIAQGYIGTWSAKSCCDCGGASCGAVDLTIARPIEWQYNYHRDPGGTITRSPATVAGFCCCYPNDVFRLVNQWTTLTQYNPDGTVAWSERFDIVRGTLNPTQFVDGFRRIDPITRDIGYGLRLRVYDGAGNLTLDDPNWQNVGVVGPGADPVGCPWTLSAGGQLVTLYSFLTPLHAEGMHTRGQFAPQPWDAWATNGFLGGWFVDDYSFTANCGALAAAGLWTRRFNDTVGGPVVLRLEASAAWSLTSAPLPGDPCSGGCPGIVAALPTNPIAIPNPLGGLRSLIGGL